MSIIVCPDKFKGSLSAIEVCRAIEAGVRRHAAAPEVILHPMSDGGDGMLDILAENLGLRIVSAEVSDPLCRPVPTDYGIATDGSTAYVEMSRASGLVLLHEKERNCLETTTRGTGELILDALRRGAQRIVLGIGGSATNDGGIGAAAALGYRFLDQTGAELAPVGKNLVRIASIDDGGVVPELRRAEVVVASDVKNPFHGRDGAARVFARQKGADDAAIEQLDRGLANLARLVQERCGVDLQRTPGAGAAGGLGGGAIAFLGARLESGIAMMIDVTGLEARIAACDFVITGEGRLDEQTLGGKVVDGVARVAARHGKRVAVVCGSSSLPPARLRDFGIHYCTAIMREGRTLADAMAHADRYVEEAAADLYRRIAGEIGP